MHVRLIQGILIRLHATIHPCPVVSGHCLALGGHATSPKKHRRLLITVPTYNNLARLLGCFLGAHRSYGKVLRDKTLVTTHKTSVFNILFWAGIMSSFNITNEVHIK